VASLDFLRQNLDSDERYLGEYTSAEIAQINVAIASDGYRPKLGSTLTNKGTGQLCALQGVNGSAVFTPVSGAGTFTQSEVSTAPNASVPVDALLASGASANIDIAVVPKGSTGSFMLAIPDGTVYGGNKRGTCAVDSQLQRSQATRVASGVQSFAAGSDNTASGNYSTVFGRNNTASGQWSYSVGNGNLSAGDYTFTAGVLSAANGIAALAAGDNCYSNGAGAASIGGYANQAIGTRTITVGGAYANTNSVAGQVAFGHNSDALGRYQSTRTGLRQSTVGATLTRATADAASGSATNQLALRSLSAVRFTAQVVAFDAVALVTKEWEVTGLIRRGANAAATVLVNSSVVSSFADAGASAWVVAAAADTTNGALAINVTGAGTNTIRWMIQVQAQEVM